MTKSLMESLRGSGRTTRMLQFAIEKAMAGEKWIVVGRKEDCAERLWRQCQWLLEKAGTPHHVHRLVVYCGGGCISFEGTGYFSWRDWCLRGHNPFNVLVDHAAIEAEFQLAIVKVHQFDDPAATVIDQMKAMHKATEESR